MLQRLITTGLSLILLLAISVFVPSVAEANEAPTTVGTIPAQTLKVSGTDAAIDVSSYFSDPDGDTLTYTAGSSDTAIATVSVSSATVTISAVAIGTATITVTATDPDAETADQTISVTVNQQNRAPTTVGTIPAQTLKVNGTDAAIDVSSYFSDLDGDTLTYTAGSSDTAIATVSVSSATVTISAVAVGTAKITVTATDPDAETVNQTISATVNQQNRAPVAQGTIPTITLPTNHLAIGDIAQFFSDPDGDPLTYTTSSSDTDVATVSMVGATLNINTKAAGSATITVTATDTSNASLSRSFTLKVTGASSADAVPSLTSEEQLLLAALLTHDTVIFNELHNSSDDANDWLELRNTSDTTLALDDWQLTIRTSDRNVIVSFPAGTVIPAGEVLLISNTESVITDPSVSTVVFETFALPQTDFALILRSPTVFGDLAGNYFQGEQPETAPELTVGTVWERSTPIISGYRAEAWTESTSQNGLGTPGYHRHPAPAADLNNDGVVNILDLVLVASQFGTTDATADLNADGAVDIADLVFVANAWGSVAAAPTAGTMNTWLQMARQSVSDVVATSIPDGFSYARGIQTLEQLSRALTPETTALLANYPNPFNPETWIPYQLSKAADVTISIHAADGTVVRTLTLGHQDAGMYQHRSHAAYWDGKNALGESVASGLYFYTLTAGDFAATRRMLILK